MSRLEDLEAMESEELLFLAQLAEQSERYDDMAKFVSTFVKKVRRELSAEERNFLSVAYKNLIGARRYPLRVLHSIEGKESSRSHLGNATRVKDYRREIEQELAHFCQEVIGLIDNHVLPHTTSAEGRIFFCKMKVDYYRFMCESAKSVMNDANPERALASYESAFNLAMEGVPPTHPTRLGLALSFSVYLYEILQNQQKACEMARKAFDDAISDLDNVPEEYYKDTTLILQLLRDNLTLWTAEAQDRAQ